MLISITVNLATDETPALSGNELAALVLKELGGDPERDFVEVHMHVAETATHGTHPGEVMAAEVNAVAAAEAIANDDAVANDDALANDDAPEASAG